MARLALITLAILIGTGAAKAEDWSDQISRAVEMPAHRWLAEQRAESNDPTPFTTDGCSGGMSSLWTFMAERYPAFSEAHGGVPPWETCCVTHDRAYHDAGPDPTPGASYDARLAADEALRQCVQGTVSVRDKVLIEEYGLDSAQVRAAYGAISESMFQAVRLGGGPCTGLPWRWGYGYPHCWTRVED
ncbi:hypothetical protein [Tateyamaria sp.]|uniref:hypothetical protein n=1 Tax=Tateyamaria sp. TaxID=1929288 RepID=UPI00329AB93A